MCCEDCPEYKKCEENNLLKDDCCPECPDYYDCAGMLDSDREGEEDNFKPYKGRGSNN